MTKHRYVFATGTEVLGTIEEIQLIAKSFGVKVDYEQFKGSDALPRGFYPSETKGLIEIKGMSDFHLRRALIKVTKEYFMGVFAQTDSIEEFLMKYMGMPDNPLVEDLFTKKKKRA